MKVFSLKDGDFAVVDRAHPESYTIVHGPRIPVACSPAQAAEEFRRVADVFDRLAEKAPR